MTDKLIKTYTPEELRARGAPKMFTTKASEWKAKLVDWFETHPDGPKRKLYSGQVEQLLIDMLSYGFSLLGKEAQMASEQRWLLFAKGGHLDVNAANNGTFRLKASAATCQIRFSLPQASDTEIHLSKGQPIRVTGSADVVFLTDADLVIQAGESFADIGATATVAGLVGNGYQPGRVSLWQSADHPELTAANATETQGGADEESAEALIYRAARAHDRISKSGPRESYRQQARAFSPAIIDVAVIRPEPGHITLYPLLSTGLPTDDFRARLLAFLPYDTKRPQGDDLSILAPEAVTFTITGTAWGIGDLAALKAELEVALTEASSVWSRRLGDYLALSVLTCVARSITGLVDIDLTISGLPDRQLQDHQFAVMTSISLTMETVNG